MAFFPLASASIDEVTKKDKTVTDFSFALTLEAKKNWRTVFCADSKPLLEKWLFALKASIYIAKPNIFGTTLRDACLKANCLVPKIISSLVERILDSIYA